MNIRLIDHVIVTDGVYYSFNDEGMIWSVLGRGLPEGWLCIRAICVARCIKASRRMLRTSHVIVTDGVYYSFNDEGMI